MPAEQDRVRWSMLGPERAGALEKPVHRIAVEDAGRAAEAVCLCQPCEQLQIDFLRQPPECSVPNLVADLEPHPRLEMLRNEPEHLPPDVEAVNRVDVEPIQETGGRLDALLLVIDRPQPAVHEGRRARLAEV